jgi:hypothetical protein
MAAFNRPLIHSETLSLLARAAASTFFRISALNRIGTMDDLASPLGSFGRPAFLGLDRLKISTLLHVNPLTPTQ